MIGITFIEVLIEAYVVQQVIVDFILKFIIVYLIRFDCSVVILGFRSME